ncbi:hypothetical protein NECAME_17192 [Necator americanus]|uniref:Uncharacterized protein n=1 Tax=Necator americanus TaxID=51031 RepID=W2TT86_NECAM|nr:hypothetical protein NECAME_17192 [Necator americanus]ETN84252.1 hypothetical protein NECAME_17192 [Necator americanus]
MNVEPLNTTMNKRYAVSSVEGSPSRLPEGQPALLPLSSKRASFFALRLTGTQRGYSKSHTPSIGEQTHGTG